MKVNGQAIYGTRMFDSYGEGDRVRFTQTKDGQVRYIFLFDFPKESITISKMPFASSTHVKMLGSSKNLIWKKTAVGVQIATSPSLRKLSDYVWVIEVTSGR